MGLKPRSMSSARLAHLRKRGKARLGMKITRRMMRAWVRQIEAGEARHHGQNVYTVTHGKRRIRVGYDVLRNELTTVFGGG